MANLKVTLVKSTIGAVPKHKKTVEALGLKNSRVHTARYVQDIQGLT